MILPNMSNKPNDDPLPHIHGVGCESIPMFNQHGTAYSQEERENLAKKKGICVRCGIRTHEKGMFTSRGLTNARVYQGFCIQDYSSQVPPSIYQEWEAQFRPQVAAVQAASAGNRKFRNAARAIQFSHDSAHSHPSPSHGPQGAGGSNLAHSTSSLGVANTSSLRAAAVPITRDLLRDQNSQHQEQWPSGGEQILPSPGNQRVTRPAPNASPAARSPPGSDTIVHEDYSGGTSDEIDWQLGTALRDTIDKPTVLKQKLHRLRNIGDHSGTALNQIKEVMDLYSNDPRVMAVSCSALWRVTAEDDGKKEEASELGVIIDVVNALRNSNDSYDTDFVTWALGCLTCLSHGFGNKGIIAEAGGIEAIVASLESHPKSGGVFEWSARALHSLVYCYENEGDEKYKKLANAAIRKNIVYIDEAGGIRALVSSMKNHSSEAIAQMWVMKLLWRLQDREEESATRRVIQKMCDEHVVQALVKVLKGRSTTPAVYEYTASLMFNVLAGSRNQNIPDEAGDCLRKTLRMMTEHPNNESLQEACCRLLSGLASSCRLQIKEDNGLTTVISAMSKFPTNLELQEACGWILWTMSYIPAFFDYAILTKAFDSLKVSLQTHTEAVTLMTCVCGMIANVVLSNNTNFKDIPVKLPVIALSLKSDERRLFDEAGRALANMCMQSANLSRKVVENNGIQALINCLGSSGQPSNGVISALCIISNASDDNKRAMIQAGCLLIANKKIQESWSILVTEKLLELMSSMALGERRSVFQLPNDIFADIIQVMRTQLRSDHHSLEVACSTICNLLCVSTPGTTTLIFDDIVEYMTELISSQLMEVQLKVSACSVLWALTARHTNQTTADMSTMFRSVVGCMKIYNGTDQPYNSELQSSAAGALASITNCIRDNNIRVTSDDLKVIFEVFYMTINDDVPRVEILEKLLEVLLNLSIFDESMVVQEGGLVVVLDSMIAHERVEGIQEKGCSILALLSSTENLQVNISITETDGIDLIVSALASFSSNQRIQVDACKALSHLSVDHESRMLIASQGGLILIVNAMNSNQDNVNLLEAACSAILNLSADSEEQVLVDSNVVEAVVNLMTHHRDASLLQEKALGVLQNVSMRNANAKASISQAGGIRAVAAAIREFIGSPNVLERAFTTMWSLAVLEQNQVDIANSGGIGLVVNGMMANIDSEKVQKQACGCLCVLSSNSRNKTLIREAGGVDAIIYAMWAHYDSEILLIEACKALSSLAVNVQTNEVMLATDGEVNAIISAMRRFPDSAKLQENSCIVLRNFMLSQENADLIGNSASELIGLLQRASARFPDKCRDRANQILANLV